VAVPWTVATGAEIFESHRPWSVRIMALETNVAQARNATRLKFYFGRRAEIFLSHRQDVRLESLPPPNYPPPASEVNWTRCQVVLTGV
jgi:hypothetical protein